MSTKNALAATVRQLPVITGLQELWQKREDESDQDYWAFLEWLDRGSERGAPAAKHLDIANRHEWSQRALAYERASDLQRGAGEGQRTPEAQIIDSLTRMCQIEAQKILKQSATEVGPIISMKDLTSTISLLADLQKQATVAQSSKTDLSKLTTAEIKQVLDAQAILRKTK